LNEVLRLEADELGRIPGIKWVDKRTLGGLDQPNPLIGLQAHTSAQRVLRAS
jgi:hypothetical protein